MSMQIRRKTRDNRRYSRVSDMVVVDRTGNHKANYVIFAKDMVMSYVVVFHSLRAAKKCAESYCKHFDDSMPIFDRKGKVVCEYA